MWVAAAATASWRALMQNKCAHNEWGVSSDSHLVEGWRSEWSFQFFPLIIIINTLSPFNIPSVFDELVPRVHTAEQSSPLTDSRVLIDVPEVINNVRFVLIVSIPLIKRGLPLPWNEWNCEEVVMGMRKSKQTQITVSFVPLMMFRV